MGEETLVQTWVKDAKRSSGWLITLGVLGVVVGIMALGSPLVAGISVTFVVGTLLVFTGVTFMIAAFRAGNFGSGLLGFLGGLLTVIAGMVMWARPMFSLGIMTLVLACYFLLRGTTGIMLGYRMKPVAGWKWTVFSGLADLILGLLIWKQWPLSGNWAIGVLVGIHIIFQGWALVSLGMAARTGLEAVEEAVE